MTNTTLSTTLTDQVKARVAERREEMIRFMREIVAIPSISTDGEHQAEIEERARQLSAR